MFGGMIALYGTKHLTLKNSIIEVSIIGDLPYLSISMERRHVMMTTCASNMISNWTTIKLLLLFEKLCNKAANF